jgi:hypothetical protein
VSILTAVDIKRMILNEKIVVLVVLLLLLLLLFFR